MTTMLDYVYINGTGLHHYLVPISLLSGFIAPPPVVGADYQIPGYVGAIPATLGKGPRTVTIGGVISGRPAPNGVPPGTNSRALYIQKLDQFAALIYNNNNPFDLKWVSSGTTRRTTARYLSGLSDVQQVTPWAGRVAVDLLLLNPYWT